MNIHLCDNEKFIPQFISRFETFHFNNYYIIINLKNDSRYDIEYYNIKACNRDFTSIYKLAEKLVLQSEENVNFYIHYLDSLKARVVIELKNRFEKINIYWIFYGGDLYSKLSEYRNYKLIDKTSKVSEPFSILKIKKKIYKILTSSRDQKYFEKIVSMIDFFCFWNVFDFELLISNFNSKAKFKPFIYNHVNLLTNEFVTKENGEPITILINHSASSVGNHLTILDSLNQSSLKHRIERIIVPLSYGSEFVKRDVVNFGKKEFEHKFLPLVDFMDKEDYYDLLISVDIAFFGHRRQQAGFNILQLLTMGTKVYLRKENNLSEYFKSINVKIGIFESKISVCDLKNDLTLDEKKENRKIILDLFSSNQIDQLYKNL